MNRNPYPFLATVIAVLSLGLLTAAGASASQVQPVSLETCAGTSGCTPGSSVRVDEPFGLIVEFKVTNPISSGNSVFVELPPGHAFLNPINVTLGWKNAGYGTSGVTISNENRRLQVPIPSWLEGSITSTDTLEVNIGLFSQRISVPATPGSFNVNVWTSADVDSRASNSVTTTVGLPSALASTQTLTGTAGGSLSAAPTARLTDSRGNPLPNQDITFTLPATGPGGTFEGGGTSSTGKTDSEGYASPALPITANSETGEWEISLSGPNSTSGTIDVTTGPAAADEIELELSEDSLPADGTSTTTATIRVFDEFGNAITGDEVGLDTEGGPAATTPALQIDDSFVSTLTASTTPGEFTITAEDTSVEPAVTTTATFTQTELPPTDLQLSLEPSSIVADGTSTTTVVATVEDELGAGVPGETVVFESDGGNQVTPTVDHGDGTYSAVVTSTTNPGVVTITGTDESPEPPLSADIDLTQTATPTPPPPPPVIPPPVGQPQGPGPQAKVPATTIRSGPKGKTRSRKVKFAFAAPGASGFQCRLDKKPWRSCTSPARYTVATGAHVFRVRALGPDGKPGPAAKRSFRRLPPKR